MPILINPAGRYIVIDEQEKYEYWRKQIGFKIPSKKQAEEYLAQRDQLAEKVMLQKPTEEKTGKDIYMATVSQGGKDGYGIASIKLIEELKKQGIGVQTNYDKQKIALLFHNPYSIMSLESPYRIIYTMFESDKIPDDWHDYLTEADEVIVPSRWCQEVFKKSGIDAKVVPLGYDDAIFKFKERENKRQARKDFVFLHYNAFNIRKGFPEVLKAFIKAFEPGEPVKMIFKTVLETPPLLLSKEKYPNIEVITGKCSEQELANICYRSDAFVFPSRGEGFGMTPLEAMATGI